MTKENYKFFQNKQCQFFPGEGKACHSESDPETHNCLFCWCPLYEYEDCGGDYTMTEKGIKDCSDCLLPHKPENYQYIVEKVRENSD